MQDLSRAKTKVPGGVKLPVTCSPTRSTRWPGLLAGSVGGRCQGSRKAFYIERREPIVRAFKQLLRRLDDLHGMPFGQLATQVGVKWNPKGPASNKSFAGDVVQSALGEGRNSSKNRDLHNFGLEIKTIPIGLERKVIWNTKICGLNYAEVLDRDWESSHVYHKMRTTLFVPVVKRTNTDWNEWYMWGSFIWLPTEDDEAVLKADYEAVRALVKEKKLDAITSKQHPKGPCKVLIPNTGGQDSSDMQAFEMEGETAESKRRAWFLHKSFTQRLVDVNLEYAPLT